MRLRKRQHIKLSLNLSLLCMVALIVSACEGPIGPVGAPGLDGANGVDGKDGAPGVPGMNGKDGDPGVPGMDGGDGAPGTPGMNGADGICAGRAPLEIVGLGGLPETIYEYQQMTLMVMSNAVDPTSLSLSIPTGSESRAVFTDLGSGSLSMITGGEVRGVERFTMFATDGCTIATYIFELGDISTSPTSIVNVVNLTEVDIDVWSSLSIEGIGEIANLEISYLGLDANTVESERPIKRGQNIIRVFNENEVNDLADGFEPESLLGEFTVTIEPDRYYILTLEEGESGVTGTLIDMGAEPITGDGVVSVSHQAISLGLISLFTVDNSVDPAMTTEVISALEYGQTSDPLAMPDRAYVFGVDSNADGEVDVNLPEFEVSRGTRNLVIANHLETACYTGPAFTIINANASSFLSDLSIRIPDPPLSNVNVNVNNGQVDGEELANALPYLVSYTARESVQVGDSSYRQINAPAGTNQIRLGVSFDTEDFWDEFIVLDEDREELYRGEGVGLCAEIIVPGDVAILGVSSDNRTERSGYIIRALSFE